MARPAKTQWNFGELFPVEQTTRKIYSVAELTRRIRELLEQHIGRVWVSGEITNLKTQLSGHIYFTLKDALTQINCVLFRGEEQVDRSLLEDGRKMLLQGEITVYEARGQYQLRVTHVELHGLGSLQAAFERLKQKLNSEGLFAQERKRPLPQFPQRIGLVTSPTAAALRDVVHVVERRNPALELILAPCRVQGDGAGAEIAAAIRLLNDLNRLKTPPVAETIFTDPAPPTGSYLDLILLTRGGGSLEDLWAFNEEIVARAIFHSQLPVVSAIGHEIDFTISDFVADLRAATPSAAAELITEGVFSSCQFISQANSRMRQLVRDHWNDKARSMQQNLERLARQHPRRRIDAWFQGLDDLSAVLKRSAQKEFQRRRLEWRGLGERLLRVRPRVLWSQRRDRLSQHLQRLFKRAQYRIESWRHHLAKLNTRLRLLGPEQVLARGYSITLDAKTGQVLRDRERVKVGQRLRTRLRNGEIISAVEE